MIKKTSKILFIPLSLVLVMTACEKVIEDFNFLESEPKLVINAPFIADSIVRIHISHTIGIMDNEEFSFVEDASAELYSNDILVSTAVHVDSGFYSFNLSPLAGETYLLKVESPDYPSVEARIEMPETPSLTGIEYVGWDEYGVRIDYTIDDPGESANAYGLSQKTVFGWLEYDDQGNVIDTLIEGRAYSYLTSSDINVTGGMYFYSFSSNSWEDYFDGTTLLIEDNLVNGKEFHVSAVSHELNFAIQIDEPIEVLFEAFNEDYIRYLRSVELYERSIDNPIAEKVSLYSNIDGGLGIAYGKTITRQLYTLPPEARSGLLPIW